MHGLAEQQPPAAARQGSGIWCRCAAQYILLNASFTHYFPLFLPPQAANKEKAVAAAVEASDAAAERGDKFLVTKIDVGLDAKALQVSKGGVWSGFARVGIGPEHTRHQV